MQSCMALYESLPLRSIGSDPPHLTVTVGVFASNACSHMCMSLHALSPQPPFPRPPSATPPLPATHAAHLGSAVSKCVLYQLISGSTIKPGCT